MTHIHIHMQHTLSSCSYSISERGSCIDQAALSLIKAETRDKKGENRKRGQTKDKKDCEENTGEKDPQIHNTL